MLFFPGGGQTAGQAGCRLPRLFNTGNARCRAKRRCLRFCKQALIPCACAAAFIAPCVLGARPRASPAFGCGRCAACNGHTRFAGRPRFVGIAAAAPQHLWAAVLARRVKTRRQGRLAGSLLPKTDGPAFGCGRCTACNGHTRFAGRPRFVGIAAAAPQHLWAAVLARRVKTRRQGRLAGSLLPKTDGPAFVAAQRPPPRQPRAAPSAKGSRG